MNENWQIILAIIIVGLSIVMPIYYSHQKKKKAQQEELDKIKAYGEKIFNVHIKDRVYKGSTVPLLSGNVDFTSVMEELSKIKYKENFILQTARSSDGLHAEVLVKYKNIIMNYLDMYNIF